MRMFNISDRKGQIGQILTSFPVLFLVFFLILIFVIVSAFISTFGGGADLGEGIVLESRELMLREVEVTLDDKVVIMSVYESVILYHHKKIERSELKEIMRSLVDDKNECLIFAQGEDTDPIPRITNEVVDDFYFKFKEGKARESNKGFVTRIFKQYNEAGNLENLYFYDEVNDKVIYLRYYYGECLNEENE